MALTGLLIYLNAGLVTGDADNFSLELFVTNLDLNPTDEQR